MQPKSFTIVSILTLSGVLLTNPCKAMDPTDPMAPTRNAAGNRVLNQVEVDIIRGLSANSFTAHKIATSKGMRPKLNRSYLGMPNPALSEDTDSDSES